MESDLQVVRTVRTARTLTTTAIPTLGRGRASLFVSVARFRHSRRVCVCPINLRLLYESLQMEFS